MPADSRTLEDEGVVIPPTRLARAGELDRELLDELTAQMRGPRQRVADLRAQLAANRTGGERLAALAERYGLDTLAAAMSETLDYAERRTRARDRRARRTASARPPTCSRRADGDLELRAARHRRRRATWRSTSPAAPTSTTATSTARSR